MLNRMAGFLGVAMAFLSMSILGLLSLIAPKTTDNIVEYLMEWAETDDDR